jgi:hypothetical protein
VVFFPCDITACPEHHNSVYTVFFYTSFPFDLILVEGFVVNSICTQMFEIAKELVISRGHEVT